MEAVLDGIVGAVRQIGGIPHKLLGNTADVDARAPKTTRLDDRDTRAVLTRAPRASYAATAATDDDQIEFVGHTALPKALLRPHVTWVRPAAVLPALSERTRPG